MANRLELLIPIDRLTPCDEGAERCSFCAGPIDVDTIPTQLWHDGRQATFVICDECADEIVAVAEG